MSILTYPDSTGMIKTGFYCVEFCSTSEQLVFLTLSLEGIYRKSFFKFFWILSKLQSGLFDIAQKLQFWKLSAQKIAGTSSKEETFLLLSN